MTALHFRYFPGRVLRSSYEFLDLLMSLVGHGRAPQRMAPNNVSTTRLVLIMSLAWRGMAWRRPAMAPNDDSTKQHGMASQRMARNNDSSAAALYVTFGGAPARRLGFSGRRGSRCFCSRCRKCLKRTVLWSGRRKRRRVRGPTRTRSVRARGRANA